MPNPWDIPPIPTRGDDDQDTTFAAVGRVLTQWEILEAKFARMYGWLVKRPDEIEVLRDYGKPQVFKERIERLRFAAEGYFRWNPHQQTEAEFSDVTAKAVNFSKRRNDVAHSIVRPFEWMPGKMEGPQQFCAAPPEYVGKKFDKRNMPTFIYTSVELVALTNALFYLGEETETFLWKLILGEDGIPP